jgi:hypothetical protein
MIIPISVNGRNKVDAVTIIPIGVNGRHTINTMLTTPIGRITCTNPDPFAKK